MVVEHLVLNSDTLRFDCLRSVKNYWRKAVGLRCWKNSKWINFSWFWLFLLVHWINCVYKKICY